MLKFAQLLAMRPIMKLPFAAVLIVAATFGSTSPRHPAPKQAPQAKAAPSAIKPKPVATVPIRPATQTPADTANAMAQAERLAIQSDLAWVSLYNGAINGEVSERMVSAIKAFQKDHGGKQTGVLNPQERGVLSAEAKKLQDNVGWKIVSDATSGARVGLPTKLVPLIISDVSVPNGRPPPAPSRSNSPAARKPAQPPRPSPTRRRS